MDTICLVEDSDNVSSFIKRGLTEHNYKVEVFTTGEAAHDMILQNNYNLVILDVMLPGYERY
jgi:DNA-binding response OmpR family regulator